MRSSEIKKAPPLAQRNPLKANNPPHPKTVGELKKKKRKQKKSPSPEQNRKSRTRIIFFILVLVQWKSKPQTELLSCSFFFLPIIFVLSFCSCFSSLLLRGLRREFGW
jgi:hypothetical protein